MGDFFDPTPEQQIVVLIDATTLRKAEELIESCEQCDSEAELPFDALLDRVTGSDPAVTDYILGTPRKVSAMRPRHLLRNPWSGRNELRPPRLARGFVDHHFDPLNRI